MEIDPQKLSALLARLEELTKKQDTFRAEIDNLKNEILFLQEVEESVNKDNISETDKDSSTGISEVETHKTETKKTEPEPAIEAVEQIPEVDAPEQVKAAQSESTPRSVPKKKSNMEEFIGGNLINKIGIGITILGVFIGTKYAIDHDYISPLTRIILAYICGLGLMFTAIKLKSKYQNFSAVLLSGSMAINYFVTFIAYSFYDMIPQAAAFALMVMFTAFTVVAALNYNKEVIAIIGLVGAYAVPFLLSDGSGRVAILFSYMAIVNVGILAVSIKKHWKPLLYSAFGFTWLIYAAWFADKYDWTIHQETALIFGTVFFLIFYSAFVTKKIIMKEKFEMADIALVLSNSFVFYGFGYAIIDSGVSGEDYLGLFTLANAMVHSVISYIIYRNKLADRNIFYLVSGLVLLFITITIPVQLDGSWVTLLWAGEAALLYRIGRSMDVPFYERLAVPLIYIAFVSLLMDWGTGYFRYTLKDGPGYLIPVINIQFLTSVLFIAAYIFIYFTSKLNKENSEPVKRDYTPLIKFSSITILLVSAYFAGFLEVANYFSQLQVDSLIEITGEYTNYVFNKDLELFGIIWILNYSLLFISSLMFFSRLKAKNEFFKVINLILGLLGIFFFLSLGLFTLSLLRDNYLTGGPNEYYQSGIWNLLIRYISLLFAGVLLYLIYNYYYKDQKKAGLKIAVSSGLHITIIWILSSELLNWLQISGSENAYKLGLSILWGLYSLFLIIFGIRKNIKHLRIGAIILFSVTLLKLFIYDIAHLETIDKTIVFVSLGILLLIISFLYNKYKHIIVDEN